MTGSALLLEQRQFGPIRRPLVRRFSVWCGSSIGTTRRTVVDLASGAMDLLPGGLWDEVEVLVKAGEGGSYQAQYLHPAWGDPHPLALDGPDRLRAHIAAAKPTGVRITPYVVVRFRPAWLPDEQAMIRQLVSIAGRCVLNVEPGLSYYNGPPDPGYIARALEAIGVDRESLEVCSIPRAGQVAELGGPGCLQAWCSYAGRASWECYGISAGQSGATSLLVNEAIPRLDGWGVPAGPQFRIPVVQRGEVLRWAYTPWADAGLQVWYMEGN